MNGTKLCFDAISFNDLFTSSESYFPAQAAKAITSTSAA